MYAKLIFRNARRSIKDYLIYIVTMTICVMLFYAFLSISSAYYCPDLGTEEYDFTLLSDGMKIAICTVTLLILFLIRYVNNYMLKRKQKEFAIQSVIGMEQRTVGWLFFSETIVMGMVSIAIGIFIGMICAQFITAMLLSDYGQSYQFTWTLFPDTVLITVCFFTISFFIVGFFNIRTIKGIKIIDMLNAEKQNETNISKSRFMPVITVLYFLVLILMLVAGIRIKHYYFDTRLALVVHILFWGNIIAPAFALLWPLVWLISKKKYSFNRLISLEIVLAFLNTVCAAGIPIMRGRYMLSYGGGVMNQYMMFIIFDVIYIICGIIFLSNSTIISWKEKSPEHKYSGQNLFLLGQITSKLTTTTKTMILICITLVISIVLFITAPVLTQWSLGYLSIRSMYDVQISTRYNDVYDESELPQHDYSIVTDFLDDREIETNYDCTFFLYLPNKDDFHSRVKWEFPVVAISLSDYNTIRNMLGYEQIKLNNKEFTTQWQSIATDDDIYEFINSRKEIYTDAGYLTLSDNAYYEEPIGETVYNSYTDVLYVFPDSVCKELLGVMRNRYIKTAEKISFSDAQALEKAFTQAYPEKTTADSGTQYSIRTNTIQVNSALASNFILKTTMIYGAVVLMVICLTILSLQQLLDAAQYKYRFRVIRQLGVEEQHIEQLILKQLGVWFGLPVVIAIIISGIILVCFLQTISVQISAYIGIQALITQVAVTISILTVLLICYFISTFTLFVRSVSQ